MATRGSILIQGLAAVLAVLLIAAGLFHGIGPARIWGHFGPPDLGGVDFATLRRRTTPNDALACRPELCAARADIESPAFDKRVEDLFLLVLEALAAEPRLQLVAEDAAQGTLRYVQRSRLLGFPDTINVKIMALPEGRSTVLLYSRSQLGRGDQGVNRARITRWMELISSASLK